VKWLLLAVAAAFAALAAAYRFEDPFLKRRPWPSPREREAVGRLMALHDYYETNRWS